MNSLQHISRRKSLQRFGSGFGGLALGTLLSEAVGADQPPPRAHAHFRPRANAVIQLYMHGGPSHVDLLDPKPLLNRFDGTAPPDEVADDETAPRT